MAYLWIALLCGLAFAANHAPPYSNPWCSEGKSCSDDSQCKQANGVNGACCSGVCRNFQLARGELCGASLPASCPSCDNNLKCADAGNGQFRCEQQNVATGCLCNSTNGNCISTQPCLPSGYCGASSVAPGGRCEVNSQCYSNSVCNGTCQPVPNSADCTTQDVLSNLCLPGSICASNSKCTPIAQINQGCSADYECAQPGLWCANNNLCANRAALGANCTGTTSCVLSSLCNSGTCVTPRTVAGSASCTQDDACVSGICGGAHNCTRTHFAAAGQACNADLDCPFGASCQGNKTCTPSGLQTSCDPTLSGGDMDKECQGSNDLFCSCSGLCLATDAAIEPTGTATSDCQAAKDALSQYHLGNLKGIDTTSLTSAQRTAIATDQCCKNCNQDVRVSQIGISVNCATKTIAQPSLDSCGLFSVWSHDRKLPGNHSCKQEESCREFRSCF